MSDWLLKQPEAAVFGNNDLLELNEYDLDRVDTYRFAAHVKTGDHLFPDDNTGAE